MSSLGIKMEAIIGILTLLLVLQLVVHGSLNKILGAALGTAFTVIGLTAFFFIAVVLLARILLSILYTLITSGNTSK